LVMSPIWILVAFIVLACAAYGGIVLYKEEYTIDYWTPTPGNAGYALNILHEILSMKCY